MAFFQLHCEYNPSIEPWSECAQRLEKFFIANAFEDVNRKCAVFLTVVVPTTYGLLWNISPAAPRSKSLTELIGILNGHYDPVPSEIVERFKLSRVQRADESVADYITELRKLAKYPNYGDLLDMLLRDRIICGIQNEEIQ